MEYKIEERKCKILDCSIFQTSEVSYREERSEAMDYDRMNKFRLLGMTQADLAEATQLSRTHISNIEAPNGKTSISLNKLFDIAEVLDVPMKDLFDFRDK